MWRPKSLVSRWPPTKHRNNITKPPTTEGIGNSRGVGGVKDTGNSRGEGGWTIKSLSRGSISFRFRPEFEHYFLPTWQIIFRTWITWNISFKIVPFDLNQVSFLPKAAGCNFKGIRPTTTCFITSLYIRPPLLVTSLPQDINTCNTSRCVSRSIEEQ